MYFNATYCTPYAFRKDFLRFGVVIYLFIYGGFFVLFCAFFFSPNAVFLEPNTNQPLAAD